MMGPPVGRQDRLFYDFCLEDVVPADHLLRKIDAVLDLSWLRGKLRAYYSDIGRPSVCPELMIRTLLVGYCYSVRSERRLCEEVALNLAYRWFCRLGPVDRVEELAGELFNRGQVSPQRAVEIMDGAQMSRSSLPDDAPPRC
jgi:transposase